MVFVVAKRSGSLQHCGSHIEIALEGKEKTGECGIRLVSSGLLVLKGSHDPSAKSSRRASVGMTDCDGR
jgi:hypothetical protein